jgi:hypothetical protein
MARLKTERYIIRNRENGEEADFKTVIYVDTEGNFTTTIPPEMVKYLEYRGVRTGQNRQGTPGYFKEGTLGKLDSRIRTLFMEAMSMTLVDAKIVIRYQLTTNITYCLSEGLTGEVVPNGGWVKGESKWFSGSQGHKPNWADSLFGLQLYVDVQAKNTYKLNSGREVIKYGEVDLDKSHLSGDPGKDSPTYYLEWIKGCRGMKSERLTLIEIPYTEMRAKLFVDMIKGIAKISQNLDFMQTPETVMEIADSNEPLKLGM